MEGAADVRPDAGGAELPPVAFGVPDALGVGDELVSLAVLLASAGASDGLAFAELYERTSAAVNAAVRRVLSDFAQADEVTQEVYLQAWQHAASYQPDRAGVLTWLLTIAHRRAVDRVRHNQASRRRDDRQSREPLPSMEDPVAEQTVARIDIQRVHDALDQLPTVQRQAVILSHIGGYTHPEIAELLNVPLGTVKSRISNGIRRLRLAMAPTEQ